MGHRWTIEVWVPDVKLGYKYRLWWEGESIIQVIFKLYTAKLHGYGCIKLEWR
jgi:hypothetical protein